MKQTLFYMTVSLISLCIFSNTALAQTSILDKLLRSQPALVTVTAQNTDVFKSPVKKLVINPKTGRLVSIRGLAQASYNRRGAGVIIHPDGIIVTNSHTIYRANYIKITLYDRTTVSADVIRVVKGLDLALLKIEPPYPLSRIAIADSDKIRIGDEIYTIGNSPILHNTISGGQIRGLVAIPIINIPGQREIKLIRTTFNVYQGDSGGPLFDEKGRLIGLMTAKELGTDHSSFAVPSNEILKYLLEYMNAN